MFMVAAVLVAGTISMTVPASFAQSYYGQKEYKGYEDSYGKDQKKEKGNYGQKEYKGYDNRYAKKSYDKDPYAKDYKSYDEPYEKKFPFGKEHDKDSKGVSIQKIKCVNSNVNINGIDIKKGPQPWAADAATAEALQGNDATEANRNGLFGNGLNIDRNLVNICVNFNYNDQEDVYGVNKNPMSEELETIGEETETISEETETIGNETETISEETETISEETETIGNETETIGNETISQQVGQILPMETSSSIDQSNSQLQQLQNLQELQEQLLSEKLQ